MVIASARDPEPSLWSLNGLMLNLAVAAAYLFVGEASLAAATEHRAVSSLWPPSGIALFAIVRFGPRLWPGVALAAYLLNHSIGIPSIGALAIAAGDTLEPLLGAHLVLRVWATRDGPRRPRDVGALALLAGGVSTAVAATIGVATLVLSGATTLASAAALWLVWWTGDAVGVLVVS
ncbi:MAG: MASE1 domain-containing protein, partial [Gemmatimonadaceae bacterium]